MNKSDDLIEWIKISNPLLLSTEVESLLGLADEFQAKCNKTSGIIDGLINICVFLGLTILTVVFLSFGTVTDKLVVVCILAYLLVLIALVYRKIQKLKQDIIVEKLVLSQTIELMQTIEPFIVTNNKLSALRAAALKIRLLRYTTAKELYCL